MNLWWRAQNQLTDFWTAALVSLMKSAENAEACWHWVIKHKVVVLWLALLARSRKVLGLNPTYTKCCGRTCMELNGCVSPLRQPCDPSRCGPPGDVTEGFVRLRWSQRFHSSRYEVTQTQQRTQRTGVLICGSTLSRYRGQQHAHIQANRKSRIETGKTRN